MAKKAKKRSVTKRAAKTPEPAINEGELTAGQLRKLNALRKSVGEELGNRTFVEWLKQQEASKPAAPKDKNADLISETLMKLIEEKKVRIPRHGYILTRGRGRVIVRAVQSD